MRNSKKGPLESDDRNSKWTMVSGEAAKPVPPPAPTFSASSMKEKKKDENIIGQWNTLEPVISAEEKRLLESLKGKLKNQQSEPAKAPLPVAKKVEEKEKPRERSHEKKIERREKSRDRRDRSRDRRDRSRSRGYRNKRSHSRSRSWSRGRYRRYSRSRSNSRGRRRVERPIVNFPEPRLPPTREDKKLPARSYVISKKEDTSANAKKVMPMIGKMPVFKKQLSDKKAEGEDPAEEKVAEVPVEESNEAEQKPRDDTWDDYMPDPMQYSALMGAPPPPPQFEEEPEVIPPGLDPEQDSEFIPQPISDAPIARKGPLPKDFQDTLDLLYDGDTPKPVHIEPKPVPEAVPIEQPQMAVDPDAPQMISAEDLSQHNLLYTAYFEQQQHEESVPIEQKPPTPEEPKQVKPVIEVTEANGSTAPDGDDESKNPGMDMDELAMLGIDVNDVGSGFW